MSSSNYWIGIGFFMLQMFVSCGNDIVSKFMGQRLDALEVTFFRFFFGLITLLPFACCSLKSVFSSNQIGMNLVRGILGAVSFFLYIYAVIALPLAEVVVILWTIPLFSMVFSKIFLKETVSGIRWIVTIIGFIGLAIVSTMDKTNSFVFNALYIIPVAAAFLFALQDIIIKKMVNAQEDKITMLMYFALVTSIVTFIPTIFVWKTPTLFELSMLFLLGIGGNLIQYFIFKAFSYVDVSAVAPYRYLELLVSALMALIFFLEIPEIKVYIGAAILIPSTLYLGYSEHKKNKRKKA